MVPVPGLAAGQVIQSTMVTQCHSPKVMLRSVGGGGGIVSSLAVAGW